MCSYLAAAAVLAATLFVPAFGRAQTSSTKGKVVEEIVARVNNEIVTLTDLDKARESLREDVQQDCPGCPPDKLDTLYKEREKDLLRDLIDQSLLAQRAKDDDINVESDLIKRLDEIREQNKLPDMDAFEKAVESEGGVSWEDYKSRIRKGLLTQEVIRKDVGQRITIGHDEVQKYYDEHQSEFVRPEQVLLAEIVFNTDGKTPDEVAAAQKKANEMHDRLARGDADFFELAKRYSEGPTAKQQNGELGAFERGMLAKQIEDVVFAMNKNDITSVIQTKAGFEIFKVVDHFPPGQQPLEKVEPEIMNKMYLERMQPVLRTFLGELREESYVVVKSGYVDTAGVPGNTVIQEVPATPDTKDKKAKAKKPKVSGQ
jgi:peptidyl-prolyl cis-trans isomerase SurA